MGFIDSRGVYIYDNNDDMVPHSTYMNLGQQSISNALAALRTELTDQLTIRDTGWFDLAIANGWSATPGYTPQGRGFGDIVMFRGRVQTTSGSSVSGAQTPVWIPSTYSFLYPNNLRDAVGFIGGQSYRQIMSTTGQLSTQLMPSTNVIYISTMQYMV